MMTPDLPGLGFERRTGVKTGDIDDFLSRATEIEQQIADIKSGKVSLDDLKAREEVEAREKAAEATRREQRRVEMELRREREAKQAKVDERERWWEGASVMFGEEVDELAGTAVVPGEEETARERALRKYENDYARWGDGAYEPDDEATVAERAEVERAKEEVENAAFEKQNPDFCTNFLEDQKKRVESNAKKDETAAAKRLRGNRYFQAKRYDEAVQLYKEALKVRPYDRATLLNIAQVALKVRDFDDALEFSSRAVRISKSAPADFRAKVFSRRAAAYEGLKRLDEALADLRTAVAVLNTKELSSNASSSSAALDPVTKQLAKVAQLVADARREVEIEGKAVQARRDAPSTGDKKRLDDETMRKMVEMMMMTTTTTTTTTTEEKGASAAAGSNDDDLAALERTLAELERTGEAAGLTVVEKFCDGQGGKAFGTVERVAEVARALQTSRDARVLFRVRRGLEALCLRLGAKPPKDVGALEAAADGAFDLEGASSSSAVDLDAEASPEASSSRAELRCVELATLAAACREEPKSKQVAMDLGAVDAAVASLCGGGGGGCGGGGTVDQSSSARAAAAEVVAELVSIDDQLDGGDRAVRFLLMDRRPLLALIAMLAEGASALDDLPKLAGAAHAARCLRDLASRDVPRMLLVDLAQVNEGGGDAVEALARFARNACDRGAARKENKAARSSSSSSSMEGPSSKIGAVAMAEALEHCATALAQIAFEATARPLYAIAIDGARDAVSTPCGALLRVAKAAEHRPALRAAALSALANACAGDDASTTTGGCYRTCAATEAAGGVAVAFSLVCRNRNQTAAVVKTRAAQLLARLVTTRGAEGSAASTLRASPKALAQVAAAARDASDTTERDALVRAVAGAFAATPAKDHLDVLRALHVDHDAFIALALAVLPNPRTDLGEYTAQSVALPYNYGEPTTSEKKNRKPLETTVANVTKQLIAPLSTADAAFSAEFALALVDRHVLERLIGLIANYQDKAVRKNAAIVLAKTMALHPAAKDRVRQLRGMEMITTLGTSLL